MKHNMRVAALSLFIIFPAFSQVSALRGRSGFLNEQSGALTIGTLSPLPSGPVGAAYSTTLFASGGITPYTWTIIAGTICGGLSLSTAGVVSGTPVLAQTCSFTVQVQDSLLATDSKPFSLTITATGAIIGGTAKAGGSAVGK